jgi:type I restriction enzyme S subunit
MNSILDHLDLWSSVTVKKAAAGRGSNGNITPYGIQKLRELILELAVRGRLVPQLEEDGSAEELLKNAKERKAELLHDKVIRRTKAPATYDEDAEQDLPRSWVLTTLYELGVIGPRNSLNDDEQAAFVPMEKISDKYGVPVDYDVRVWKEIKSGFTHFQENDVVLAKITPCFQNGKSCVMKGLKNGAGAGTTELHVFQSIPNTVVPEFVLLFLKSPGFILEGIPRMTGTAGQKRITRDYFAGKPFPLPPLAEQHRIVAKVDELMALCDQLEQQQTDSLQAHQTLVETVLAALVRPTARADVNDCMDAGGRATQGAVAEDAQVTREARMPGATGGSEENAAAIFFDHFDTLFTTEESIDQLKQTILQLAVMGRLVPQDTNDEPASFLLEKIAGDKEQLVKDGKAKKQKPTPERSDGEKPFSIPDGWSWTSFEQLVDPESPVAYGVLVPGPDVEGGVPFVRIEDLDINSPPEIPGKSIAKEVDEKFERTRLKGGEILMGVVGSIGKLGVAPASWKGANIARAVCRIVPVKYVNKDFILWLLQSAFMQNGFIGDTRTLAQPTLNIGLIRTAPTPLPPLEEQNRIVAKVDELLTLCDTLKAQIQQAQTTQVNLADAIVEQAVA